MKNLIAKIGSKLGQSGYSDRELQDEKAQHVHLGRNRWQTLLSRWFFVNIKKIFFLNLFLHTAQ